MDFVAYRKKPETEADHTHSIYCIKIDDGSFKWSDVQKYIKITHNMKKDLMIVKVDCNLAQIK
jgi:tRNA splicing endonuclease